jgi:hypothetical protein
MTLSNVKTPTSSSYHSYLIESLKDPQEAAAYLDAVLEDCTYDELDLALRNVAEARLGSLRTNTSPEVIEEISSSPTSIDLFVLLQKLGDLGFKLSIVPS